MGATAVTSGLTIGLMPGNIWPTKKMVLAFSHGPMADDMRATGLRATNMVWADCAASPKMVNRGWLTGSMVSESSGSVMTKARLAVVTPAKCRSWCTKKTGYHEGIPVAFRGFRPRIVHTTVHGNCSRQEL